MRRYDIDTLRVIAILAGLFYHAALAFGPQPWIIQNQEPSPALDTLARASHIWRMPLLFLLAGAGTYFALGFRSTGAYAGERTRRLLVPLLMGLLLLAPIQVYVERISSWASNRLSPLDYHGNFLHFYPSNFTSGWYPAGNFAIHHLWFIAYLFGFSIVALPLLCLVRQGRTRGVLDTLADWLNRPGGILLGVLPLVAAEALVAIVAPQAGGLRFLAHFVFGYLLVADPRLTEALQWQRRLALVGMLGLAPAYLALDGSGATFAWLRALGGLVEWLGLVTFLAYGQLFFTRGGRWLSHANEVAYPFYLWHQPVIVVAAYFILPLPLGVLTKYAALCGVSLLATALLCELVKTTDVTRFLFGLKPLSVQEPVLVSSQTIRRGPASGWQPSLAGASMRLAESTQLR